MRTAGAFFLALLLPAFALAADPPTLVSYSVTPGTIHPAASDTATSTTIDIAFSEQVKASIKIMSGGSLVKSLYSSSAVTNPSAKIWDGTNSAGAMVPAGTYTVLVAATSTATGLTLTDSSKTVAVVAAPDVPATVPETTPPAVQESAPPPAQGGGTPEYLPIPSLRILTERTRTVASGAETPFSASVYDGRGNRRDDATISWSFGDGMRRVGASVYHAYYEPGEYVAVVRAATSDGGNAVMKVMVTAEDASVRIASVSAKGIAVENRGKKTLDLSRWRIGSAGQEFTIPEDTEVLPGHTVLFSSKVTGLSLSGEAELRYPSGEIATSYPVRPSVQPASVGASLYRVQDPQIIRQVAPAHEDAVMAPAAAAELASAGAALAGEPAREAEKSSVPAFLRSPWTLGLLGVMVLAGGAFILL